jgi:N-acetylmuramoyl-L-alanine amidase
MKMKILAMILSAGLLLSVLAGCGMKMPDDSGQSPSGSPSGGDASAATTVTGIVSFIDNETIKLELVKLKDAQSPEDTETVTVGAAVYIMSGITQSVTPENQTAVVFQDQGYASGTLDGIVAGDFLAVVLRGDSVLAVLVAGHAEVTAPVTEGTQPSVEPTGSSEPSPSTGIPDTTVPAVYTVKTDDLKVRSGPGIEYSVLGELDTGSRITGIITSGWIKYTYDGKEAYSSAQYVELSTAPEGVPDSGESKTYTTTDNVLARSGPGTTHGSLGTLQKGTEVTGTVLGGWLKFTYNDKTAYCNAAYLTAG